MKNKTHKSIILACALLTALLALLSSCAEKGAPGPAGADGVPGPQVAQFEYLVFPEAAYAGSDDSFISAGAPGISYGTCTNAILNGSGSKMRMLVKFDMNGYIPSDAVVEKAYLTVYAGAVTSPGVSAVCHKLTKPWLEGTTCGSGATGATWNTYNSVNTWTTAGGDFETAACSAGTLEIRTADNYSEVEISAATVQEWVDNPSSNYGMIIKAQDESIAGDVSVFTNESGTPCMKPRLTVYYKFD